MPVCSIYDPYSRNRLCTFGGFLFRFEVAVGPPMTLPIPVFVYLFAF
jgi:hypothetical protein